jgi:hypothetical protein
VDAYPDDLSVPENIKDIRIYCCNSLSITYQREVVRNVGI